MVTKSRSVKNKSTTVKKQSTKIAKKPIAKKPIAKKAKNTAKKDLIRRLKTTAAVYAVGLGAAAGVDLYYKNKFKSIEENRVKRYHLDTIRYYLTLFNLADQYFEKISKLEDIEKLKKLDKYLWDTRLFYVQSLTQMAADMNMNERVDAIPPISSDVDRFFKNTKPKTLPTVVSQSNAEKLLVNIKKNVIKYIEDMSNNKNTQPFYSKIYNWFFS